MHYNPHSEQEILPLKLKVRDIHDYILRLTPYEDDTYITERINIDKIPVRIKIENNPKLVKYNAYLIESIELHQAKSTKVFDKNIKTYDHNIYRILSVKHNSSDKPIDVSSDNIFLTANEMYADKAEIKEYKAKELAPHDTKKTKSRESTKKEEKQERIIAILVNLLAKESVKAKSNHYIKGKDTINALAISRKIVELADEYEINKGLSSDTSLATEINAILNEYPDLKKL